MARDYGKVSSTFWTGETGRELRKRGQDCQLVAAYLMTCHLSNMIGLYYLPMPVLSHETGLTIEGATKALRRVCETGFASYDDKNEVIWVPEMAAWQIGRELKAADNQIKGIVRELEPFRKSRFYKTFYERYEKAYNLPPARPITSSLEGPSETLRSQEQEQEQEQDQEHEQEQEVCGEPVEAALMVFPTVGKKTDPREWNLFPSKLAEYQEAFPGVDVLGECRRALQWVRDNPPKRKTARGMPAFLHRWLSKEQDRGGLPGRIAGSATRQGVDVSDYQFGDASR